MYSSPLSQTLPPLTHFASWLSTLAAASQRIPHQHINKVTSAPKARHTSTDFNSDEVNQLEHMLSKLGLLDLPVPELTLTQLSPLLGCTECTESHNGNKQWHESYISAKTFFENKNGFREEELHRTSGNLGGFLGNFPHMSLLAGSRHFSPAYQQVRGFKTRDSIGVGLGSKSARDEQGFTAIRLLKQSMAERGQKSTSKSQKSDTVKNLIDEYSHTPDVQEKIKVAFAEGYAAKQDGQEQYKWLRRAGRLIFYVCIIWLAIQLVQMSAMGGNMKINVLKSDFIEVNPEEIKITFKDVRGADEAKQELTDIVEFLRDPDKFKALGAKLPKGCLLVGPPGIGKTLLARAVAGEAGVPFFHVSGSEFDEIFVGTGAQRVRRLFNAAKMRAPCVIFIDEIDTVGAKRTSSQIHPYANQTINQLLSEMDGFEQNEGIIVLGATNRRDNLDQALLRPGRFDVEVRVFPPDLKGRKEILELYLSKIIAGRDLDIDKLARGTTGFTGADIENMVNQAALKAAKDGAPEVTMAHMEFARDKVLMGPAKKNKIPDDDTNWMTAYHEAGHTIVAFYTKDARSHHKTTILPRGMSLGHTSFIPAREEYNQSRAQLMAQMDVAMGGRVAEEIIYGPDKVTTGASSDFQQATAIATAMVRKLGMSEKVGYRVFDEEAVDSGLSMLKVNEVGPATTELVDQEIKRLLQESYERSKNLIKTHQSELKALATALMKYETLDAEETKLILEGKQLDKKNKIQPASQITNPFIATT